MGCHPMLKQTWRWALLIIVPIALLPLLLVVDTPESRCGYVLGIMAFYWMLELLPIPVTALVPLVMMPVLGILPAKVICMNYFKDINFLLFGGLVMALAVESCMLHKRIALKVLLGLGGKPPMIMLAFAIVTAFLSMFLSNTATTALMVPIAMSVLEHIPKAAGGADGDGEEEDQAMLDDDAETGRMVVGGENGDKHPDEVVNGAKLSKSYKVNVEVSETERMSAADHATLTKAILLGVCYSANIGGTGTLTGTGPNLVLMGQLDTIFEGATTGVNYATWMAFAIPPLIVCLFFMWVWLMVMFSRKSLLQLGGNRGRSQSGEREVMKVLRQKLNEMGGMTFAEKSTLGWFCVLITLWMFRSPRFMPGWGELFTIDGKSYISDGTSAMFVSLILFAWPSALPRMGHKRPHALVTWPYVQKKMAWGVIFIIGGSMAIADAVDKSGLSNLIGCQLLNVIGGAPILLICAVVTICLTFITELTSNTATSSVFLPIVIALAERLHIHPLYLALPATIAPSFAFMLPVATAPNAIVYETGLVKTTDMMKAGFIMNWLCIGVTILNMNTYGTWLFNLNDYPDWAASHSNVTTGC